VVKRELAKNGQVVVAVVIIIAIFIGNVNFEAAVCLTSRQGSAMDFASILSGPVHLPETCVRRIRNTKGHKGRDHERFEVDLAASLAVWISYLGAHGN
jgi:hypothetical protein